MKVDFEEVLAILDAQIEVYRMEMTRAVRRGSLDVAQMSLGGIEAADRLRGRLSGKWFDELHPQTPPEAPEKTQTKPKGRMYRGRREKGEVDEPTGDRGNSRK